MQTLQFSDIRIYHSFSTFLVVHLQQNIILDEVFHWKEVNWEKGGTRK